MAVSEVRARTYGNWRKPASPGIGALGLAGTLVLLVGLVMVVISMMISVWLAMAVAVLVSGGLAPMLLRDQFGRNGLQRITARVAWLSGQSSGNNLYRSGPLGRTPAGTCQLPGLAAASTLSEAVDGHGRPFGLLSLPRLNHHTIVISTDADGASLVDQDQVDTWVAHWGNWLSNLAYEPSLVAASVTVEAAPDPGTRLGAEVSRNLSPNAPDLAREVLEEVVRTYPTGSATLTTRIALTYSGAARNGMKRRTVDEMAQDIGTRLHGLTDSLSMTGAGSARPMTATALCEAVRVAYDPSVATLIEEARASGGTGMTWDDAGPTATEDRWNGPYRHDGAWSLTWAMGEAPRGEVFSSVLAPLLQPHPDMVRKRVTLLYRPHSPAEAARIVESDRKDALFKAQQAKVEAARDMVAVTAANQAAREEATGAGLVRFALLVTATVLDPADLPKAASAVVDNLSAPARIRLRLQRGAQASAFAACLPIGIVVPLHLRVPQAVRDSM